jgi:hypothetical protein
MTALSTLGVPGNVFLRSQQHCNLHGETAFAAARGV